MNTLLVGQMALKATDIGLIIETLEKGLSRLRQERKLLEVEISKIDSEIANQEGIIRKLGKEDGGSNSSNELTYGISSVTEIRELLEQYATEPLTSGQIQKLYQKKKGKKIAPDILWQLLRDGLANSTFVRYGERRSTVWGIAKKTE